MNEQIYVYESEEEAFNAENIDVDEVVCEFSVRYRSECKEYRLEKVFEKIDSFWKKRNGHDTSEGYKQCYYCNCLIFYSVISK